jgi:hypothetical protein
MNLSLNISDLYVRRARLQPALLVALPIALAVLAYFPTGVVGWGILWSLLVWCGGTALLAQIARDPGKRKEPELLARWGGKPTTRLLRHRDASNKALLARRHAKLAALISGQVMPTVEEESSSPTRADDIYDSCTAFLRAKTEDRKSFPLVFEENCNYGFRRNLWGMKPLGIFTAVAGSLTILSGVILRLVPLQPLPILCGTLDILFVVIWVGWITPSWVRIAADSYAERLLAVCDSLEPQRH